MLKLLSSLSRRQRGYVFLAIDLLLIPLALLFTYTVQSLPISPLEALWQTMPSLPYLMAIAIAVSKMTASPPVEIRKLVDSIRVPRGAGDARAP